MEKILTAEEFIQDYWDADCDFMESMTEQLNNCSGFSFDNIPDLMAQFAKYHVKAALKAAGDVTLWKLYDFKEDIIKSYPLENIE